MRHAAYARPKRPRARRAPSAAERITEFSRKRGGYGPLGFHTVEMMRRDGRFPTQQSGDYAQRYERDQLIAESRRLERDNPIYQGMLDKASGYIVGNGFGLQAKTSDPEWNANAEAEWEAFWAYPEITGLDCGFMVEQLACRELLTSGDFGALKLKSDVSQPGKIQLVESEQIKGKSGSDIDDENGVTRTAAGTVERFWVAPWDKGTIQRAKAKPYGRDEFLFCVRRHRPSVIRGIPPAQGAFAMLHRINDVCDSEALARQLLARLAISITRPNAQQIAEQLATADPAAPADTSGRLTTDIQDLDYGLIVHGEPGDEIKGIERNVPGADFPETIEMFLRLLGLPLGLPLEITLLNWTKSNYSQSRAVLEQAYTSFITWQLILEHGFHRPLYKWCIDRAIAAGRLSPKPESERYAHEWIRPTFPWIDQLNEAKAYEAKLALSLCTHAEALKSQNKDRDEVVSTREREIRDAIERSQRIKADTGEAVPWQTFCGLPVPTAAPAKPAAEESTGASEETAASPAAKPGKKGKRDAA